MSSNDFGQAPHDPPPPPGWWQASDGRFYPPQSPSPYPPSPYGYGAPVATRTNGLAIASMVLGILWLYWVGSILALVFGYVARSQIKKSGGTQSGMGMAIAGIVLGWIGVGVVTLIFVLIAVLGASDVGSDGDINSDAPDGSCDSSRFIQDPDC